MARFRIIKVIATALLFVDKRFCCQLNELNYYINTNKNNRRSSKNKSKKYIVLNVQKCFKHIVE